MIGAVKGIDARSGHYFDDTQRYVDAIQGLSDADRTKIYEGNALRVYPRLKERLGRG
jgi:4-oxalmesaconate hydratase